MGGLAAISLTRAGEPGYGVRVGNSFTLVGFVQTDPQRDPSVLRVLSDLLHGNQSPGLQTRMMPAFCFGKHDFVFAISSSDLSALDHSLYTILAGLTAAGEKIRDYAKFLTYDWLLPSMPPSNVLPPSAISLIKLAAPRAHEQATSEAEFASFIYAAASSFPSVEVEVLGSFGLQEFGLLLRSRTLAEAAQLVDVLGARQKVLFSNTIPVVDVLLSADGRRMIGKSEAYYREPVKLRLEVLTTRRRSLSLYHVLQDVGRTTRGVSRWPMFRQGRPMATFGSYDLATTWRIRSLPEALERVAAVRRCASVFSTASLLSGMAPRPRGGSGPVGQGGVLPPTLGSVPSKRSPTPHSTSYSTVKLEELKTKLGIALGLSDVSPFLPVNVVDCVSLLLETNISRDSTHWFLSEMNAALAQRLSGLELGALLGRTGGILERQGGRQRMLLACDRMLLRAYYIMLERAIPPTEDPRVVFGPPVIMSVFDLPGNPQSVVPDEIVRLGLVPNIPMFVHLSMDKNQPWEWVAGLSELCMQVQTIISGAKPFHDAYDLATEKVQMQTRCLNTLAGFLERDVLKRLLAEESGVAETLPGGRVRVDVAKLERLRERFASVHATVEGTLAACFPTPRSMAQYDAAKTEIRDCLASGRVVPGLDDPARFLALLNAFLDLGLRGSATAREISVFVLSLCDSHDRMEKLRG